MSRSSHSAVLALICICLTCVPVVNAQPPNVTVPNSDPSAVSGSQIGSSAQDADQQSAATSIAPTAPPPSTNVVPTRNFFQRLGHAYWDDWHPGPTAPVD